MERKTQLILNCKATVFVIVFTVVNNGHTVGVQEWK